MVDIETMGTRPGSVILSIGAVEFDHTGILSEFYVKIDKEDAIRRGFTVDDTTLAWWNKQDQAVREEAFSGTTGILDGLTQFCEFAHGCCLWGNGSDFDNVLILAGLELVEYPPSWFFYNHRCYRTVKSLWPKIKIDRTGSHHNALDDARSQALHLIQILNTIRA